MQTMRVFLSYTAEDLREHADVVLRAIRRKGLVAVDHRDWASNGWGGGRGSSAARARRIRESTPAPPPVPSKPAEPSDDGLDVGVYITHPLFGGGRILNREGNGKHIKLTIHFNRHGQKKILPAYTQLEITG